MSPPGEPVDRERTCLGNGGVISAPGERYRMVVERAARAALCSGRRPADVTVVVAAKSFGVEAIRAVVAAGARDVGESYVQEAKRKRAAVGAGPQSEGSPRLMETPSAAASPSLRWHLIGRLQRNKAKPAVELFDLVHSLDSFELARALDRAAATLAKNVHCLVEVRLGGEVAKGGAAPEALGDLLGAISSLAHVRVEGLMAIPPPAEDPEASRPHFARLRRLRDDLERLRLPNVQLKDLSMGMSADFEVAVEEGATLVRVGTAIFGPRRGRE